MLPIRFYLPFPFFALFLLFFGCKDQEEPISTEPVINGTIGGYAWQILNYSAEYRDGRLFMVVNGLDGGRVTLSTKVTEPGNYDFWHFEDHGCMYESYVGTVPAYSCNSQSGYVQISKLDLFNKVASGSFICNLYQIDLPAQDYGAVKISFENIPLYGLLPLKDQKFWISVEGDSTFRAFSMIGYKELISGNLRIEVIDQDLCGWIDLNLSKDIGPGLYAFGGNGEVPYAHYVNGDNFTSSAEGELYIYSHDQYARKIAGSFYFTGKLFSGGEVKVGSIEFTTSY